MTGTFITWINNANPRLNWNFRIKPQRDCDENVIPR